MPWRALVVVAVLGTAIAALAATSGRATARHGTMTPAVGPGPKFHVIDQLDGPSNQPGRLRQCQLDGTCYGPDQMRNAYGFQPLLDKGITGAGQTIVIIDAYGSDTIQADLNLFDSYFGIPATTVNIVYPDGPPLPTTVDNRLGWKGETTLDVEWAHAMAPGATIDLVVARSNEDADILSATKFVSDRNLGDVLSQSYGEAEQCMSPTLLSKQHRLFARMTDEDITLFASSGDQGAAQFTCDGSGFFKAVSTPASDPYVTAVGGTDLVATPPKGTRKTSTPDKPSFEVKPGGQYVSETTWNDGAGLATGGGVSVIYSRPDYQSQVVRDSRMREIPDIAYSASVDHVVLVVMTCDPGDEGVACGAGPAGGTFFFGFAGTSAGSPQWAALVALADQAAHDRVGFVNPELYSLGASHSSDVFHDIVTGDNSVPADPTIPGTPIAGFSAGPGWDAATGLGSPKADKLVPALASGGGRDHGGGGDH